MSRKGEEMRPKQHLKILTAPILFHSSQLSFQFNPDLSMPKSEIRSIEADHFIRLFFLLSSCRHFKESKRKQPFFKHHRPRDSMNGTARQHLTMVYVSIKRTGVWTDSFRSSFALHHVILLPLQSESFCSCLTQCDLPEYIAVRRSPMAMKYLNSLQRLKSLLSHIFISQISPSSHYFILEHSILSPLPKSSPNQTAKQSPPWFSQFTTSESPSPSA